MNPLIDVIIPTWNNEQQLISCLQSMFMSLYGPMRELFRVIVVNNGDGKLPIQERNNLKIIEVGKNLGWEGGLKLGLEHSKSKIVIFANDDIRLIQGNKSWIWQIASWFNNPEIGAVGPCSNFVMGAQNIFADNEAPSLDVKFLIGFFYCLRREALDKAGGIDDTLPGGDDIDLSIRLRDAGYKLIALRDLFVFHHGQQTGQKVHEGYWNSPQMQERTNTALIRKHGMFKFWDTMVMGRYITKPYLLKSQKEDVEGDICRKFVEGDKILELGCGGRKTVENSVGIDLHRKGEFIPFVTETSQTCVSDIQADVSGDLPVEGCSQNTIIARHVLEHCQDPIGTLSAWNAALKFGGKLIIAVPHNGNGNTIMMNPEHLVSYVPSSLEKMARCAGFEQISCIEEVNGVSFVSVFEKVEIPEFIAPQKTVFPLAARLMEAV